MWMQVALLLLASLLHAGTTANVEYNRYQSDSGVLDSTPAFEMATDLGSRAQLQLKYAVDAVSAASFNYAQSKTHQGVRTAGNCNTCHPPQDALSGATQSYLETRHGLTVGVTRGGPEGSVSVAYQMSRENDYSSDGANLHWQGDTPLSNTTLGLNLEVMKDGISSVNRQLSEFLFTQSVEATLTHVFSPNTVMEAGYAFASFDGYQQSPYAFVEIGNDSDHPQRVSQPRRRGRQDLTGTLKQGLWPGMAVQTDYRYYNDDWGVIGHTVELTLSQKIGNWVLEPSLRRYWQPEGAYFFKNFYDSLDEYRSRDLKLAPHSTRLLGLALRGRFSEHVGALLGYSYYLREDSLDYSRYWGNGPESANMMQFILTYE